MIRLTKGYINPSENQRVLVELEDSTITGAIYRPTMKLEDPGNFKPVGVDCLEFETPVVSWGSL